MGAGTDGGENLPFRFVLREHLIADAGVLNFKGNHFAQAEADERNGFRGFCGKGIEVEDEDADEHVGQEQTVTERVRGETSSRAERMAAATASGARRLGSSIPGTMAPGESGTKA